MLVFGNVTKQMKDTPYGMKIYEVFGSYGKRNTFRFMEMLNTNYDVLRKSTE